MTWKREDFVVPEETTRLLHLSWFVIAAPVMGLIKNFHFQDIENTWVSFLKLSSERNQFQSKNRHFLTFSFFPSLCGGGTVWWKAREFFKPNSELPPFSVLHVLYANLELKISKFYRSPITCSIVPFLQLCVCACVHTHYWIIGVRIFFNFSNFWNNSVFIHLQCFCQEKRGWRWSFLVFEHPSPCGLNRRNRKKVMVMC